MHKRDQILGSKGTASVKLYHSSYMKILQLNAGTTKPRHGISTEMFIILIHTIYKSGCISIASRDIKSMMTFYHKDQMQLFSILKYLLHENYAEIGIISFCHPVRMRAICTFIVLECVPSFQRTRCMTEFGMHLKAYQKSINETAK